MRNKKALSPLVATILLVVFALIIGTATMSWGKNYVESIPDEKSQASGSSYIISRDLIKDNPLKRLQIDYLYNDITLDVYLQKEQEILTEMQTS